MSYVPQHAIHKCFKQLAWMWSKSTACISLQQFSVLFNPRTAMSYFVTKPPSIIFFVNCHRVELLSDHPLLVCVSMNHYWSQSHCVQPLYYTVQLFFLFLHLMVFLPCRNLSLRHSARAPKNGRLCLEMIFVSHTVTTQETHCGVVELFLTLFHQQGMEMQQTVTPPKYSTFLVFNLDFLVLLLKHY